MCTANLDKDSKRLSTGIITDKNKISNFFDGRFDEKHFKYWKYKLQLGGEIYISTAETTQNLKENELVVIKPGDFVLLQTKEIIKLDNKTMAFISMRFDYKQKGLINVSGFHVDPNYHGHLIFSAFNAGPKDIVLRRGDEVFMIFFEELQTPISIKENEKNEEEKKYVEYEHIPSDMIEQIRGKSATLTDNSTRLKNLEIYFNVFVVVVIPLMIAILGCLFSIISK